jgi:integrase
MPKLTEKITDALVRKLPAPAKGNVLYYDPELPGFAVRVTAAGARSFVLVYHFEGEERRDTLGQFPHELDAKKAREKALDWRSSIRLKIDPNPRDEPEPDDSTFKALAEEFLAHGRTKRGRTLRPATKKEYKRALFVYAEVLHGRPLAEIRRREIAAVIQRAAKDRGEVTAMRTRAALSRLYTWAIANGHVEANVAAGTEGYDTPTRERVLYDAELAALWAATAEPTDFNLIVRLCLWTGCRRAEAGGMRWSELVDGVWIIPGSRTKNHRTLALPMPRQMRQAIEAWPRRLGRDHLFGQGRNGFQAWSQSKARLDARLGFDEDWDLHDIRRSVETRMAGLGILKEHANRVLNHATGPITEAYDRHTYMPEKAAALQRWADELERIVSRPAEVIPMRRSIQASA